MNYEDVRHLHTEAYQNLWALERELNNAGVFTNKKEIGSKMLRAKELCGFYDGVSAFCDLQKAENALIEWEETGTHELCAPIPDYGDHFTMEEFVSDCESGFLTDYDGTGYYAMEDCMLRGLCIDPDDVRRGVWCKDYTHVMWFNK